MRVSRRDVLKGVAMNAAAAVVGPMAVPDLEAEKPFESSAWESVGQGIWRATLGSPESFTPQSTRLVGPAWEKLQRLPGVPEPPVPAPVGRAISRGYLLTLPLAAEEAVFGFGLQLLSSECRGKKRTVRVNADPRVDSGDSHAPVPLYVSSRGYGVLVDTLRQAEFYCGDVRMKPDQSMRPDEVGVNTPQQTQARETAEAGQMIVEIPRSAGIDLYLFGGPTMVDAVRRYNVFSGGGFQPPEWGLGFWYRIEMHAGEQDVLKLAQEFRKNDIPCDVIGLEPGWQTHAYSCTFAWERSRFPDPARLVGRLAELGFRLNLWEHAFTHPASPLFESLQPCSGDKGVWGGLVPDFAGSQARGVFSQYHQNKFISIGISGFKLDECDDSDFTGGWSFPGMSRFPSGLDGEQMHAVFGLRYQHAIRQAFVNSGKETYGLVRSSGALAAPYPFALYSDLYDHRQFVRGIVTSGFAGLLWCPEVRDAASDEDLIRRLQTAVFSPLAMINAWYIRNPPWKQREAGPNNRGEFQENWQAMEGRSREIIGWRMQLIPYLVSAFAQYEQDGTPPFRALVLDYPEDASLRNVDDSFLIGDRMLVAPLFAGEVGREVILPVGEWHDFWTGRLIHGPAKEYIPAATEKIPVYVKGGSLVPWAEVAASNQSPESRNLTVRVYGDGHLSWASDNRLELSWDAATHHGKVYQQQLEQPYRIISWERIG